MEREAIEKKDLDTVKKIREIKDKTVLSKRKKTFTSILMVSFLIMGLSLISLFVISVTREKRTALIAKDITEVEVGIEEATSPTTITEVETYAMPPAQALPADIYVARSVVCTEVREHNAIGEQSVFSMRENKFSVVWTEIRSTEVPRQIKHVYYLNGKKYCEVPLDVNYHRTRTWSRITLSSKNKVGVWRVDVVTKGGAVLKQIGFEVRP